MKELYLYGNDEHIEKVLDFVKNENLIDNGKIHLVDLLPELTEEYMEEQRITRGEQ